MAIWCVSWIILFWIHLLSPLMPIHPTWCQIGLLYVIADFSRHCTYYSFIVVVVVLILRCFGHNLCKILKVLYMCSTCIGLWWLINHADKPPIEELHQFLEFQLPRQWAPMYGDLPLGLRHRKQVSPSLQFSLMGPRLYVNTMQVILSVVAHKINN